MSEANYTVWDIALSEYKFNKDRIPIYLQPEYAIRVDNIGQ